MLQTLLRSAPLLLLLPLTLPAQSPAPKPSTTQPRTPVLVELFTSEGCSSCPPADKLLATLQKQQPVANARIIVLEEHVDYWDRTGWRDRFSSSLFAERQNLYAPRLKFDDPYTPQMVVDGTAQFLGSDPSKAIASITQAAQSPKIPLSLSQPAVDGKHISCSVSAATGSDLPRGDLYAVLVDPTASTEVKSGENGGRHLDLVSVVRSFQRVGKIQDLSKGPVSFKLTAPTDESAAHMRLVVFAQLPDQGAIRGAAETDTAPKE
ncbi:DUF1223 domain-containing protein [Edaphobacter aggregans]|uniref:DUF1223 domain-containing protein n=1 Tax=Edaphobacter aggregans TaxID=570835 RepID=UPI001470521F|nr:DUF1223 domain-containing protein [Edaphobacter aggregans]